MSDVGEKRLVEIARNIFSDNLQANGIIVGIGEDTAALTSGSGLILVTSDLTCSTTHFPVGAPPSLCGWYAAAVNLSDLAAKGGKPAGIVLAVAIPGSFPLSWFESLLSGFHECAKRYKMPVIGGDTKFAPSLIMAPTAIGRCESDRFISRNGCRRGDIVCITGTLGRGFAALRMIKGFNRRRAIEKGQHGAYWYVKKNEDAYDYYEKMLKIFPHVEAGLSLSESNFVSSGMDNSDGLAMSLHELARQNDVGFLVDRNRLPMDRDLEISGLNEDESVEAALYRGGDFGLLFTVAEDNLKKVERIFEDNELLPAISPIGKVTDKDILLRNGDDISLIEDKGWEHLIGLE
ncbi:MAG: thiamine-phosphate kinase [Candidatus Thermoplasmatota archaeon]|nr:thiamine-phosphate kinase [Candidatus Thermoplasmatota archaeon]